MKFRAVLALAGAALLSACGLNSVPTAEENAKAKWADVQAAYQRRADTIPALVNTVKGAAACREACAADPSCVAFAVATGRAGQCVTSATCTPLNYERRAGWEVHARLAPLPDCWAPGALYGGHTAITKSGVNCQKWTEQWPHTHLDTPLARPGAGLGDHRYCRQVGEAVAWIGDGRAIVVHRPVLPLNGRGVVPTTCRSEAEAEAIVAALERQPGSTGSSDASTTGSATSDSPAAGRTTVVNGAGSLPPEMYTTYVVKPGDNFEKIAEAWFGDRAKSSLIAEANPYAESSRLSVGQKLNLPPKDIEFATEIPGPDPSTGVRVYRIRSGDTLGKIAQRVYGKASNWPRIYEANKEAIGENPANLRVGMEIVIP